MNLEEFKAEFSLEYLTEIAPQTLLSPEQSIDVKKQLAMNVYGTGVDDIRGAVDYTFHQLLTVFIETQLPGYTITKKEQTND